MATIDKSKRATLNKLIAEGETPDAIAAKLSVNVTAVRKCISAAKMQRAGLVDEARPKQPTDG